MNKAALILLLFASFVHLSYQGWWWSPDVEIENYEITPFTATVHLKYTNQDKIEKIEIRLPDKWLDTFSTSNLPSYYVVRDLEPCKQYRIIVKMYPDDVIKSTAFKTKSVKIPLVENIEYDESINLLTWQEPAYGRTCLRNYLIEYDGKTEYTDSYSFKLTDLPGCSNLEIRITPIDQSSYVGFEAMKEIQIGFQEPSSVDTSFKESATTNSINIDWNHPLSNPKCVEYYAIRYNGQEKHTKSAPFEISNVESCRTYEIEFCTIMKFNNGEQCKKYAVTTEYATPEIVVGPIILGSSSVNISLEYKNSYCIQYIQYNLNDGIGRGRFKNGTMINYYYADQLQACTEYTFLARTFNHANNFGRPVNKTFKTDPVLINSVSNIVFEQNEDLLTWNRPSFGAECVTHYLIDYPGGRLMTNDETIDLSRLPGCSKFQIVITPMGENYKKGASNTTLIQTGVKTPNSVQIVNIGSSSPNSVTIVWTWPTMNPNCVKHFAILFNNHSVNTDLTEHTIINLEPCTDYSVKVCTVITSDRNSVCSKPESVITKSAISEIIVASIVPEAFSVNMSLEYTNSNCINELVIGLRGGQSTRWNSFNLPTHYFLDQLEPCTEYNLVFKLHSTENNVEIVNQKIFNTKSVPIDHMNNIQFDQRTNLLTWDRPTIGAQCITHYLINFQGVTKQIPSESVKLDDLPGCLDVQIDITPMGKNNSLGVSSQQYIQSGFKMPSPVKNIYSNSNGPNSITVAWQMPIRNLGCLKNFIIVYNNMTLNSAINTKKIDNLEPCTEYSIQICIGMTNNQMGQCSTDMKKVKTKPAIPEITIGSIIPDSFSAIVPLKYKNVDCIAKMEIGLVGGRQVLFEKINYPVDYIVDNLKPCTSYIFMVTGYSPDYTNLIIADKKLFTTKSVLIAAVENIEFVQTTSELTWVRPTNGSECIKNYLIDDGINAYTTLNEFYDLTHLPGCSNFSVTITPMQENGDKGGHRLIHLETGLKEPDNVVIVSVKSYSPNSITLIYNTPMVNQNCVKNYAIKYSTSVEYTNLTTYTVINLEPCTEYSFEICIIMVNNRVGPCTAPTQKISTKPDRPETTVGTMISESFLVNVSLEYKNLNCVDKIKIGLIDGVSKSFDKPNLPTFYNVHTLKPCTSYVLYVNTYSFHYSKIFSINITVETKSVVIGPVENVKFDQSTDLLIWNVPNIGAECIDHYAIDDGQKSDTSYSQFHDLKYLPGCSRFPIQITPIGRTGEKGKGIMIEIETGLKVSDGVKIVKAESNSSDSITVIWNVPRTNRDCVKNYSIIYSESSVAEYTNLTRYTINSLEPCTGYNIQVCIVMINNEIGLCTNYTQTVSTLPDVFEIILGSVNYSSSSANVSLAYTNANCIWYFEIGLNDQVLDKYEKPKLPKFYYVSQLKPCSEYKLFINMYSKYSIVNERFTINKLFKTSSVRIPKVENIVFNEINDLIQWTQPDFGAECVRWYSVDSNGRTNVTSSQSINLSHLSGCAKHEIIITPQGDNGVTGESVIKFIQTGFKEPDHISNMAVLSTGPKSITMAWNKPNQNPNCVRNYEIIYDGVTEYTNLTKFTINHLEPCSGYSVRVCVVMVNNQPRMCTGAFQTGTSNGIPSSVQKLRYTNSIIAWERPSYATKCIKNYILTVVDLLGRQIISEVLTSTTLDIKRGLLTSCQNYSVSVIPINVDDDKGDEETLAFKTEPIKPKPPSAPKLISKTTTSIELESQYENEYDLCSLQSAIFKCLANDKKAGVHWGNVSLAEHQNKFTVAINDLKHLTNYTCTVRIMNEKYTSKESSVREFETAEIASDPPEFFISSIESKSLSIAWRAPIKKVRLKYYHLQILKIGKNYAVPEACENMPYVKSFRIGAKILSQEITNLEPYTNYSLEMAIENTAGIGLFSDPMEIITKPDTPHSVQQFRIDRIYSDQSVELKWELPCSINGEVISIKGTFYESQPPNSSVTSYEWELKSPINLLTTNYYKKNQIKPEHKYNVTIGIEIKDFTGPMNETIISFTSPAGIPTAYASNDWGSVALQTNPRNNIKLTVTKDLFSSTKGKIRKFSFLLSERNCQVDPRPSYMFFINKFDETNTRLPSWFDLRDIECGGQYQTQEYPVQHNYDANGFDFIIGNQICDETTNYLGYCNGPLKSGTDYAVIARVYTSRGYADTNPIYFATESDFPTAIVLIFVFTIICGLLVGFGIMRFKSQKSNEEAAVQEHYIENIELTPTRTYDHDFKIDLDVILDEFQLINDLNLANLTKQAAKTHKPLNRYANILPYDQNRVYLIPNSYSPTGYINASYIDGYTGPDEYIATQGPTPETCYDFWNMIIETMCHRIVMLTNLVENNIPKCAQYYPDPDDELQLYDINIVNVRELTSNLYTRRELLITKGTMERVIVQYHYQNWPDHGCPENELDLINLIQLVKAEYNMVALDAPIVVHCSAGVGRTGTLIALDILMQQVANNKNLNVCETVKNLRYQRAKMVQSLAQYQFLYKSVARYIHRMSANSNR